MALDLVIKGGRVFDGSGSASVTADIAIADGRIIDIGRVTAAAGRALDAEGLTVTPGFIDIHAHSDYTLLIDPRAVTALKQGVTLEVLGNCGFGCAPIRDGASAAASIYGYDGSVSIDWTDVGGYLDRLERACPAINVLTLVPNGQLRRHVVGMADRPANAAERQRMCSLLHEGLRQGAFGYSTGLEYPVERAVTEDEIVELCAVVAKAGALYATHTRDRDAAAVEGIEEAVRTADRTGVQLQVSHLLPRTTRDRADERAIEVIDKARERGMDIAFDQHTRLFGTTYLNTIIPSWAHENGRQGLSAHLRSKESRERMKRYQSIVAYGGWDRVVLLDNPAFPEFSRRSFGDLGRALGRDPHDIAFDILSAEIDQLHRPMVIINAYTPEQQVRTFAHPLCMPGSDATTMAPDGPLANAVFHGAYSWASWYFHFMVTQRRVLSAAEAVFRLTGLPARVLNLEDRGAIRIGARADIAIFDDSEFREHATTFEPNQLATGMRYVIVNGRVAVEDGHTTEARAGEVLRRRYQREF
jgi:N-acyl-D-aspartate/D-glutamate deacylase